MQARKEILIEQQAQLLAKKEEIQKTLDILDYKISAYENGVLKKENEMTLIND
jgi:hypothetical protein